MLRDFLIWEKYFGILKGWDIPIVPLELTKQKRTFLEVLRHLDLTIVHKEDYR